METAVTILRDLWQKRVIVAIFAVIAILIGGLVAYRPSLPPQSRKYEVGTANARILVDTPASQAVEIAPKGSETLGARASLLANLMADGELKDAIAKRAGLAPGQLLTVAPSATQPNTVSPAALRNPQAYILTTRVLTTDSGEQLPIVDVDTQAPDAQRAAALANAAVGGLEDYLDSKASIDGVSDTRRLRVRPLGAAQGRDVARGPSNVIALMAAIFVFGVFCALLLIADELARSWRAASDVEEELRDADIDSWHLEQAFYDQRSAPSSGEDNGSVPGDAEVGAAGRS
jgi:hypothetical protein